MAPPCLDHLILFLPASPDNTPKVPESLSKNFTLTPGGRHADNLTANTLILLADGCYIELISFITNDATALQNHWWGGKNAKEQVGWKDWCLTTPGTGAHANYTSLQTRSQTPIYAPPNAGSRHRLDRELVKWHTTFPLGANGGQDIRSKLPFFCHDETPRDLRVPISEERVKHPCGAVGVKELTVLAGDGKCADLADLYASVFGVEGEKMHDKGWMFELERVNEVGGLHDGSKVVVREAADEEERKKVAGRGFWFGDVVLAVKGNEDQKGVRERLDGGVGEGLDGVWVEYV